MKQFDIYPRNDEAEEYRRLLRVTDYDCYAPRSIGPLADEWRSSTFLHLPGRPQVVHDPIFTPIFVALGFTGTIGATTITVASVLSAITVTAISIGLQYLLTPKYKPPTPDDGKQPITQAIPYILWGVGRTRVAGAYMLWDSKGSSLYAVQAIAGHRCNGPNRYWLHDDEVTIDSNGKTTNTSAPYGHQVQIFHRLGNVPETPYSQLVTDLSADGAWTNNHRGDGIASMAMIATQVGSNEQMTYFPYGVPKLSAEWDLAYCWDFRDPAQDPEDESTWEWTRNAAIILAWHLCFNPYGERKDYTKALLPVIDMWKEEADVCDEDIPLSTGGTQKRYWCSGWDTTEHDPKVATNAILACCDGWLCYRGDGAILFTAGKFRESRVVTLTDADIVGYQFQNNVLPEDECNRFVPRFTYPDTDYTESDTDFWQDEEAQALVGRVLIRQGEYYWCHQWQQARRLGKRDYLRVRAKIKGSLDVRLSGINAIYARWIRLSTPLGIPKLNGVLIENRRSVAALTKGGFSMDFVKSPDNIDEWNPATDEGTKPPVPPKVNGSDIVTPEIYSVSPVASASGSVTLTIVITDPEDTSLTLGIRYRLADDGTGNPGPWSATERFTSLTPASGHITVTSGTVPGDAELELQAAWYASNNAASNWSATAIIFTTADPTPPGLVTSVSVSTGVGVATFGWTAPNSANYAGAKVYWNTVNNFSTATFAGPIEYGAANTADSATKTISAGVRYGWITSINLSGVESSPVATGSFTVS